MYVYSIYSMGCLWRRLVHGLLVHKYTQALQNIPKVQWTHCQAEHWSSDWAGGWVWQWRQ